jgi:hypothetical protein
MNWPIIMPARKCVASTMLGYDLIGGKHPDDTVSRQWTHCKIWNHVKELLFYSGDPGDLLKPAEE